jgi:glycosyltransferase involved in cell wall biosynthesis
MPIDVSVVIPFFNPGADIDASIGSMIDQTLPRDRFEVILVDDGSTDGSGERVDQWAAQHPDLLTVHHIAASGGPALPRNVGIDQARGRYIQFVDSDDTLAPRALERQLEIADSSDADVVVGKLSSDFRGVWHPLFRRTVTGKTLADYPLIQNLTVCKMFRREFLAEHGVRFPEGPHYIEDQQICIQAYAHARSVAVIGDMVCYFYRRRRTGGRSYGDTTIVPGDYFRELEAILDIIDTQVSPAAQTAARSRYYRDEMLGRLRNAAMLSYDPAYRREMVGEVRRLATSRFPADVHRGLPMFVRAESRLLLDDNLEGLVDFARELARVRLTATTTPPRWHDGRLVVAVDALLRLGDEPLRLEPDGDDWVLPESMAPGVPPDDRRLGDLADIDIDLATISRADSQLWSTTDGLSLVVDSEGCPRVRCEVTVDPMSVMGGRPLAAGLWDLRLRLMVGGVTRTSPLRCADEVPPLADAWVTGAVEGCRSVTAYWTDPARSLALDVDEWMHPLQDLIADSAADATDPLQLVLEASQLRGPAGAVRPVELIFEPSDAEAGLASVDAELRLDPAGSSVHAAVPQLPSDDTRWAAVWLRLGDIGGTPARKLAVELEPPVGP